MMRARKCAAFATTDAARPAIYHHGKVTGAIPGTMALVASGDFGQTHLADPSELLMLDRYTGTETTGTMRRVHGA